MNEILKKMKNFFSNEMALRGLLAGAAGEFEKLWHDIYADIKLMQEDKNPVADIKDASYVLNKMYHWIAFEKTTKDHLLFFKDYALVLFNWNLSGYKDSDIEAQCQSVTDLIDGNLTMREVTDIMREVGGRLNDMRSWNPPAFEISKSFLDYIDK